MRTIKLLNLIFGLMLCLGIISCKKSVEKDKAPEFSIVRDTINLKTRNTIVKINIKELVSEIPDDVAKEYIKKYEEIFTDEEKFPGAYIIDKKAYNKILNDDNPRNVCKILLTEKDSVLNLIYQNGKEKEFRFNLNEYIPVSDTDYTNMERNFNQNLYSVMNSRITTLNSTLKNNTKEIYIPIEDLKKIQPVDKNDYIFLFPGIITRDTTKPGSNLKNQQNYITLIAGLWRFDDSGFVLKKVTVFYDNFCVSPPNNC
ncbi:hypothetical protein MKJ01_01515 [Chryseobacterium sp. SSA4.19]|uniref:hypothetical protein n=1 Tax=Chryseobacterium sp. SSA4.19 TaxID=2919915 RepID=UPI001F4E726E|nr:hypothetical protein [Chryseobacterium sp. SSA4.19]MCJ8152437.1 hypothetical protein [Chryseobacterium sp. SSA4.19]